jgi:hypothetical protein
VRGEGTALGVTGEGKAGFGLALGIWKGGGDFSPGGGEAWPAEEVGVRGEGTAWGFGLALGMAFCKGGGDFSTGGGEAGAAGGRGRGDVGGHHAPGDVGEREREGERERDRERGLESADI